MYIILKSYAQWDYQETTILGKYDSRSEAIKNLRDIVNDYIAQHKDAICISEPARDYYSFTNTDDNTDWSSNNYFHEWFEIKEV